MSTAHGSIEFAKTRAESPGSKTPGDSCNPRALDDKEFFIIEGSPGTQRPDGRSAKNARKTGEKTQHRLKIMNLTHLRRTPGTAGTCRCKIAETSTPCL